MKATKHIADAPRFKAVAFHGLEVEALLSGRKSQSRFTVQSGDKVLECPHGTIGDHIYVQETWNINEELKLSDENFKYQYRTSSNGINDDLNVKWRNSTMMPKSAARIFLEITHIHLEELQNINDGEALLEGVKKSDAGLFMDYDSDLGWYTYANARSSFTSLWSRIHGSDSWYDNPLVWVVTYKVVTRPSNF